MKLYNYLFESRSEKVMDFKVMETIVRNLFLTLHKEEE